MISIKCANPLERQVTYRLKVDGPGTKEINNLSVRMYVCDKKLIKISGEKWCFRALFHRDNERGIKPINCLAKLLLWLLKKKVKNLHEILQKVILLVEQYLYEALTIIDTSWLKKILKKGVELRFKGKNLLKIIDNHPEALYVKAYDHEVRMDNGGRIFINSMPSLEIIKHYLEKYKIDLEELLLKVEMGCYGTIFIKIFARQKGGDTWGAHAEILARGRILEVIKIDVKKNNKKFINLEMLRTA
jgi:hypothetical protein